MKDELITRLLQLDWNSITAMAQADKKVVRTLLKLLYHPDDYIHWLAAEAIGKYGAALAQENPEKTRELVRRLLWNLNEECGASPWGSVEAIAAITAERPDLFANYVSILFPFYEDENLLPGVIWVQAQVGRGDPGLWQSTYHSLWRRCPILTLLSGHTLPGRWEKFRLRRLSRG